MKFTITSISEAREATSYFNDFHDGFFRRICILSSDEFLQDGSQVCTGEIEVTAEIAHNNYHAAGGFGQVVWGHFFEVWDISIELLTKPEEWSIYSLTFLPVILNDHEVPGRFECRLAASKNQDNKEWKRVEHRLFTFARLVIDDGGPC